MNDELKYRIAFASIRGMGVDLARKILEVIPSEKEFFMLSERELKSVTQSRSRVTERAYRQACLERAEHELEFVAKSGIKVTYFTDDDYPYRLLEASDAPLLLYSLGDGVLNAQHVVSVVGTRHATAYGRRVVDDLISDLAMKLPGTLIVSGLASGIDIAAHRASLHHGLPTAAVMARGLNHIYPAVHRQDAVAIARNHGVLLTDYSSQDELHRGNFLARNRIIAGLADCTVVVESAAKGGALVTASIAQSYNRDVLTFPGRVNDEFSCGCNRLIRTNQAQAITCADDLLEAMRWEATATPAKQLELFPELSADEQAVIDLLRERGEMHINDIATALDRPIFRLMATLVSLDCNGMVLTLPGCRYSAAR